jgi:hypothetical protein
MVERKLWRSLEFPDLTSTLTQSLTSSSYDFASALNKGSLGV